MNHSDVKLHIFCEKSQSTQMIHLMKSTSVEFFQSQGLSSLPDDVVSGLHESLHWKIGA